MLQNSILRAVSFDRVLISQLTSADLSLLLHILAYYCSFSLAIVGLSLLLWVSAYYCRLYILNLFILSFKYDGNSSLQRVECHNFHMCNYLPN